jgi:HEPN domain-containing protein
VNCLEDEIFRAWMLRADANERTARQLLGWPDEEIVTDSVGFHAQQMAEKYLKAFLIAREIHFRRTHSIEELLQQCAAADSDFGDLDAGDLTEFAVEQRYAEDYQSLSAESARNAFGRACAIRDLVLNKLELTEKMISEWRKDAPTEE